MNLVGVMGFEPTLLARAQLVVLAAEVAAGALLGAVGQREDTSRTTGPEGECSTCVAEALEVHPRLQCHAGFCLVFARTSRRVGVTPTTSDVIGDCRHA